MKTAENVRRSTRLRNYGAAGQRPISNLENRDRKQAQPRIQISVFKRKRFISSCRISICRSGCKRLRTFSRRSGSIAARSRTSLSRVLYLEYLLKPMPTAMSAEMVQTVMSVPVITGRLQIENYRLESRKTDQSDVDSNRSFLRCSRAGGR